MAMCNPKTKLVGARARSKNEFNELLILLVFAQRVIKKLRRQKRDISQKEFLRRLTKEILCIIS